MKKLLVAAIMVVLATPAFAAIQNVKVSGSITTTFLDRNNFDLGLTNDLVGVDDNAIPGEAAADQVGLKKQNVFVTQTELNVSADLSDNVSTTVGLINERAWNAENNSDTAGYANDTNVELYLASITMRELLYSPLTVTVGRQVFQFGNGLIIGNGGPINESTGNLRYIAQDLTERTTYDGVTATLDYKPLTITMIYFKNDQGNLTGNPISNETDSDVFGADANYQLSDPWSTVVEAYEFNRIDGHDNASAFDSPCTAGLVPLGGASTCTETDKNDTLYIPGLRASTNPIKGLNVQGEVAWQLGQHSVSGADGSQESERRSAMAAQGLASYSLPVLDKYKPTLNASFTYVSGDRNGFDNQTDDPNKSAKVFSAWDPFYEAQGAGTIYQTLFPFSNLFITSLGASVNPLEDVTVAGTVTNLEAAERYSAQNPLYLLQPDGSGDLIINGENYINPVTTNKRDLGNEADVNLTYNYTEDVTFGVSLGWYVPGDAFNKENRDDASQALANIAVKF